MNRMGYEGQIFHGVAGSTAATQITEATDITYNIDVTKGSTMARGTGSAPPIQTERVTSRSVNIQFTMLNRSTDTSLTALMTAAVAGTPIALRLKDYAAGKGFDGDVTLSVQNGKPLAGEQTKQFTATPTKEAGRDPQLYV